MGAGTSHSTPAPPKSQQYKEFQEHPLLSTIENPINRFCDDFASSLIEDSLNRDTKSEVQLNSAESEEIPGYTIVKVLGNGAEAVVYQAVKARTNIPIALKHYKKVNNMGDGVPKEYEISKVLDHPHCLQMYECFKLQNGDYVVSMPIGTHGAMQNTTQPVITIPQAIMFLKQLGSALAHMHSRNVVHRDIKPGNILVFDNGFSFCDYSVSLQLANPDQAISGVSGTSVFMSPEISVNFYQPKPADVWAFGITLYSLVFGCYPYHLEIALEENEGQAWNNTAPIARCVNSHELTFPDVPSIPNDLKRIFSGLLHKDPKERMTAQQLSEDNWINEKYAEYQAILNYIKQEQ